ncbi:MAG: DUF2513 domain-containing protein [Limisphaerales bacterium]
MKRDMELVRLLLLQYEAESPPAELADYEQQEIIYNLVLMRDAGLIDAYPLEGNDVLPRGFMNVRLTWAGHDFLDAARNDTVWNKAKGEFLKPGISWTFSILLEWLKQEARKKFFGDTPSS